MSWIESLNSPAAIFALVAIAAVLAGVWGRRLKVGAGILMLLVGVVVGENGLGVLARDGVIETLGSAGLLYLVFAAGLGLDLDRARAGLAPTVGFGAASFGIPGAAGFVTGLWLGFGVAGAAVLAAAWGSHTLVTYPVFAARGVEGNRAVERAVGAVAVTDAAAIAVLVLAIGLDDETNGGLGLQLARLVLGAAIVIVVVWLGGRWGRRLFSRGLIGEGRYLWLLVVLFGGAVVAETVGLVGIAGAFAAGLACNRLVPRGSELAGRVEAVGSAVFYPLFFLSVGMLVSIPEMVGSFRTLGWITVFTSVVVIGKSIVSGGWGWLARWTPAEERAVRSLTVAQAAATLAAVTVAVEGGVLPEEVLGAVIGVIVVTNVLAGRWAEASVGELEGGQTDPSVIGRAVLVAVANPASAQRLGRVAAAVAAGDGGLVLPMWVRRQGDEPGWGGLRDITAAAETGGVEVRPIRRVGNEWWKEVADAEVEEEASLVVAGWPPPAGRGGVLEMIARSSVGGGLVAGLDAPVSSVRVVGEGGTALRVARRLGKAWGVDVAQSRGTLEGMVAAEGEVLVGQLGGWWRWSRLLAGPDPAAEGGGMVALWEGGEGLRWSGDGVLGPG
ncbi:MAG: cation:proton antiporter [Acidimicrobiia bacterium]|jgi:Kef-type K+ transport system membrane component KefB